MPPQRGKPQVTTVPSCRRAAKAAPDATTWPSTEAWVKGFRNWGLGLRVQGLAFVWLRLIRLRVQGFAFRILGIQGLGVRRVKNRVTGSPR